MGIGDSAIVRLREIPASEVAPMVGLAKARERHKWACPACNSSDALHVYQGQGKGAHCFSCGESFDSIGLAMKAQGYVFPDACKWLGERFGVEVEGDVPSSIRRRPTMPTAKPETVFEFFDRMAEETSLALIRRDARKCLEWIWRKCSLSDSSAAYLESRGISRELADHVGIRSMTGDQWRHLHTRIAQWPRGPEVLKAAGLIHPTWKTIYPSPRGETLVFPYWLDDGGIDTLRFRQIGGGHKMLSLCRTECGIASPKAPFLGYDGEDSDKSMYQAGRDMGFLFICEGELNALSVLQCELPAVASPGASIWQEQWCQPWRGIEKIIILLHGDEDKGEGKRTGAENFARTVLNAAAAALGTEWVDRHMALYQYPIKAGMDCNDFLISGDLKDELIAILSREASTPEDGGARS
jgi:hypothetical protein